METSLQFGYVLDAFLVFLLKVGNYSLKIHKICISFIFGVHLRFFLYANEGNIRWDFERESPLAKAWHKTCDAIPLHILNKLPIFLRGSLPWWTNDRDTKREKKTSVCFSLLWSEKCKQNYARFWTELGYKLKLKSASHSGTEISEILNNCSTQHVKTLFNEGFPLVACNRCYTALCQFSKGIGA